MPAVKRTPEDVVEFCKRFNGILSQIEAEANTLQSLGSQIESALYNTPFATNAAGTVGDTAKKVIAAVQQGEQRIRERQRRAEQEAEERDRFR